MILLAILLQCISKSLFLTSFVFIKSPAVLEFTVNSLSLFFKFRHIIKQIHIFHCLNIINLINVLPTGYFIYQAFQGYTCDHFRTPTPVQINIGVW